MPLHERIVLGIVLVLFIVDAAYHVGMWIK
jgi:hypothetical protein